MTAAPDTRPGLPGRRRSISLRLSLALISVIAALLLGFAIVVAYITTNQAEEDLTSDLDAYLTLGKTALPAPVWNFDTETVNSFVTALREDPRVSFVAVISEGRDVARQSNAELVAASPDTLDGFEALQAGTTELTHEDLSIGSLTIALDRESVRARTVSAVTRILTVTGLIILAIALVSVLAANRYVKRPLTRLEEIAADIADGKLDTPVVPERNDELGALSANLEVMRSSLKESITRLQESNRTLETRVEERTADLSAANAELKDANRLIVDSIQYASRIQEAVLPTPDTVNGALADHFLIWEPRDVVGGDFVWFHSGTEQDVIIVGDCTGHGVPGAFMTLIAGTLLDRVFSAGKPVAPGEVLTALNQGLKKILGQDNLSDREHGQELTDDGLEAAVCIIERGSGQMRVASARVSVWVVEDGSFTEFKGDKIGLGYRRAPMDAEFTEHTLAVTEATRVYVATDGLIDQVGGARPMSFGKKRFIATLKDAANAPMADQGAAVSAALAAYQGTQLRRDDITVLGFSPAHSH